MTASPPSLAASAPEGERADDGSGGENGPFRRRLEIVNRKGLHARASARFVQTVEAFDAEVTISRDGYTVGGRSIMGLMMLAAGQGSTIEVEAEGPEAASALEAISDLVAARFGESC